jgi:rod shape-determining protein MreD
MNSVFLSQTMDGLGSRLISRVLSLSVLALLALVQASILNDIRIFNAKPDLLLGAVVIMAISSSWEWAFFYGYSAGLAKDLFCSAPFGVNTLTLSLLALLAHSLSKKFLIQTQWRLLVIVALGVTMQNIILALSLAMSGNPVPLGIFLFSTLACSLYSALSLPLVLKGFKFIGRDVLAKTY